MPSQRIESAAANVTIFGSALTYIFDAMNWLTQNAATVSVLILLGGFLIQIAASWRNKREHEARMQVLRAEAWALGTKIDE